MARSRATRRSKKPIVEVVWHDAASYEDEPLPDGDGDEHLMELRSYGILWERTKKSLVLIYTYDTSDGHENNDFLAIPAAWVLKVTKLGESELP